MTLPTPPRYVVLPHDVIDQAYAPEKPRRALLASFIRILSLAWESKYQHTPPLNEEELMEFLKLSRRQYFDQKADMELLQWLCSSHPRPGFVQFSFSRSIAEKAAAQTISAENRTDSAENRTAVLKRTEEEDSNQFKDSESSSSSVQPGEVRKTAPTDKTLANRKLMLLVQKLHLAFQPEDHGVLEWRPVFLGANPEWVLGWIAKAYQERRKLEAPIALVVKHIMTKDEPARFYMENFSDILPEIYLEAIGELSLTCESCGETFHKRQDLELHTEQLHAVVQDDAEDDAPAHDDITADDSVTTPIDGKLTAVQAWDAVLGQLQVEMHRSAFDSYVRHSRPVRYDGNSLTIRARNTYAREWLDSRLTSTVERMLVGVINGSVDVYFVACDEQESI